MRTASSLCWGPFIPSQEPPYGAQNSPNQCKKTSQNAAESRAIYLLSLKSFKITRLEYKHFQAVPTLATSLTRFFSRGRLMRHFSPRTNVRHHHAWTWTHTTTVGAHTTRFENNKRRQKEHLRSLSDHARVDQLLEFEKTLQFNYQYQITKSIDLSYCSG